MILVWSRKAIVESSRTRRSCRETEQPVNNWLQPKFGNLHSLQLSRDMQQFLFFVNHFLAFQWLCCLLPIGYLPKPGSVGVRICHYLRIQPRPEVKVLFRYLRPDAPIFSIHGIHSTCEHGVISAITLLILSLSGCSCLIILWYIAPVDMMTFMWSRRSYQSICQQHPPYSHPQVTLTH